MPAVFASQFRGIGNSPKRSKFDRYVSIDLRQQLLHYLSAAAHWVQPAELAPFAQARYSRDASDEKFMQLALAGRAAFLASGDADLLVLGAGHGIPVLAPAQALALVEGWPLN